MNLIVSSSSSSSSTAGQTTIQQSKEDAERRSSVHNVVTASECNKESTTSLTPSAIRRGVNVPVCSTGTTTVTVTVGDEVTAASSSSRRRRSTFYVPLNSSDHSADDSLDLSACSLDWSLNESVSSDTATATEEHKQVPRGPEEMEHEENNYHRLEIAVNEGNDSEQPTTSSSTPIKAFGKSRSRTNILNLADRISLSPAVSPLKEKSKTLPQNLSSGSASFPAKHSFLLKSSPKISAASPTVITASPSPPPHVIPLTAKSPRKSLSFIRRSHSTKVSRSSSLLRSFTRQQQDSTQPEAEGADQTPPRMVGLNAELLERLYRISVPGDFDESLRRIFFKDRPEEDEDRITKGTATSSSSRRPFEGVSCVGGSFSSTAREEEDAIHSGNGIIIRMFIGCVCRWKWLLFRELHELYGSSIGFRLKRFLGPHTKLIV